MQATKYTVTIEIEALSLDTIPNLIFEVESIICNENRTGTLLKENGDLVKWGTKSERVDF